MDMSIYEALDFFSTWHQFILHQQSLGMPAFRTGMYQCELDSTEDDPAGRPLGLGKFEWKGIFIRETGSESGACFGSGG